MISAESITSPANPRIKRAAALRDADGRRTTGLTLVDGRRELARAAAAGIEIVEVFVDARRLADAAAGDFGTPLADWLATLAAGGTQVATASERAFARVAFGGRNEGVVGVVRFGPRPLAAVSLAVDRPMFVIEGVEKPGNLGAILRTADAAGLGGVMVCDARTDVANPAVIRASLGTAFSMPLATCSTAEAIDWCRRHGRQVVAAMPNGARLWHEADFGSGPALLLGSEAHGISGAWSAAARAGAIRMESVRLPMRGIADSLNLSATAAVLAYEAVRRMEAGR
ncbi:MAG: RNA methyltransferase [Planctomycetes bacterium]|nr:RNA methyltransferase [Planctomycetota bacterium]